MPATDVRCFSPENLQAQVRAGVNERGHYRVRFYVRDGQLSREPTDRIGEFYYYPSAGTIRDEEMNIVLYSARLDAYRTTRGGGGRRRS